MTSFFRFFVVGGIATMVHFLVVIGAVEWAALEPTFTNALAWAVALGVSYTGHYRWTFTATGTHQSHLPRYALVSLSGLILNLGTVWVLFHQLTVHYLVATTAGVTMSIAMTFLASRFWAFAAQDVRE